MIRKLRDGRKIIYSASTRGKHTAATPDHWAAIPETERRRETRTLEDGTVLTSWVDTLEDHGLPIAADQRKPKAGQVDAADAAPAVADSAAVEAPKGSPWSRLDEADGMPGASQ